jgi:hypothetical protein
MNIIMRMFGILDTVDNLNLDLFNNRIFYTMLLGALMFNYFYVIMFGGLTLMYNIITGFSMSSLVIGYFIHYVVPFEPEDFNKITSELKDRIRDDADKMFKNLNIGWTTSITTDTTIEDDEVNDEPEADNIDEILDETPILDEKTLSEDEHNDTNSDNNADESDLNSSDGNNTE